MQKTKILIVEDEVIIAMDLQRALEKLDYEVIDIVTNYDEVMISINQNEPNLIMMDINLGEEKDGVDIVKDIYQTKSIPILYLTSYNDEQTMQRAFETNPVGYLIKPFKVRELKFTLDLAFHKMNKLEYKNTDQDYKDIGFGYYFDLKNQKLYYQNKFVKLSDKERKLLFALVDTDNLYLPKEELEHKLWLDYITSTSSLKTLVYRLNKKLSCNLIKSFFDGYKLSNR